ncbi:hypothetical protein ACHAWF_018956 [Thalassiosira exigua]
MSHGRAKLTEILMKKRPPKLPGYLKNPPPRRWNIVAGDTVQVIDKRHPEHGKQGKVLLVNRRELAVFVEGVNIQEKKVEADPAKGIKEGTVVEEAPVHYSNLNLVDPVTGFPTKIVWSYLENGKKVRISKRSGAVIPKAERLRKTTESVPSEDSDTMSDGDVWAATYEGGRPNKWENMRTELLRTLEEKEGKVEESQTASSEGG